MTAEELIRQALADGVYMTLTERGRLRLAGARDSIERWLPVIGQYREQLVAALLAIQTL